MRETITLKPEEQKRLWILNEINRGKLTARKAAQLLNRSVRQLRRLLARYQKLGAAGLVHGNRAREPVNRLKKQQVRRIVELAKTKYVGFNQQHFSEMLKEREGIAISRSSLRRILLAAAIPSPRQRRVRAHRSRRERFPNEGMLVQIDGSEHRWLGPQHREFTLLAAIDDATGKVLAAMFRHQEDAQGYFLLMRRIVEQYGCPLSVYRDRHRIFQNSSKKDPTLEEQLQDAPVLTQFGRLLKNLGIESIASHSPQGKGRIERLFGTFQDRLVNELRLAGIENIAQANNHMDQFLARYNRRFAVPAQQSRLAYRPLASSLDLDATFSFKFHRTVAADNTVRLGSHRLQLLPSGQRCSYVRARVEVQLRMDGSLAVYHQRRCLLTQPAPAEAPVLRLDKRSRSPLVQSSSPQIAEPSLAPRLRRITKKPRKPAANHPWRHPYDYRQYGRKNGAWSDRKNTPE